MHMCSAEYMHMHMHGQPIREDQVHRLLCRCEGDDACDDIVAKMPPETPRMPPQRACMVWLHAGELLKSDRPHSVWGMTTFSWACNYADADQLTRYLRREAAMSDDARRRMGERSSVERNTGWWDPTLKRRRNPSEFFFPLNKVCVWERHACLHACSRP